MPFLLSDAALAAIVVASSGPSSSQYPAGRKIADNSRITLQAGDTITILDGGTTRVLRGAGTVTIGQRRSSARSPTFAALTRQRSSERVRTGAVRGAGEEGEVMRPNIWYVDPTASGTMCIVDPQSVRLWRPTIEKQETYQVASADGTQRMAVSFDKGAMVAVWDAARLPIADGASFKISMPDGAQPRLQTFAVIPEQPTSPEDLAAVLIEKGCTGQLDLLSASLS